MSGVPAGNADLSWRTALSCNGGNCVRVAVNGRAIYIGDSKDPDGPLLSCTPAEWQDFVTGVKNGVFDELL